MKSSEKRVNTIIIKLKKIRFAIDLFLQSRNSSYLMEQIVRYIVYFVRNF